MDAQGYAHLTLLSTFHRVQKHTTDIRLIADAIRDSPLLQLSKDGAKVRFSPVV